MSDGKGIGGPMVPGVPLPDGWATEGTRKAEAFKADQRAKHLERIAERKRQREESKRVAKGLGAKPTDYPWLKPGWKW